MLNRRDFLGTASLAAVTLASTAAMAHEHMDHDHMNHDHADNPFAKLADTAADCIKAGYACQTHCLASFADQDFSLAECAKKVDVMLAFTTALQKVAASGSEHTAELAKICLSVCQECEKECRKHADHHATCKACAEACVACADECKKLG